MQGKLTSHSEINCTVTYNLGTRNLAFKYSFNGFLGGETGKRFTHEKIIKEIKTIKNTE